MQDEELRAHLESMQYLASNYTQMHVNDVLFEIIKTQQLVLQHLSGSEPPKPKQTWGGF